MGLREEVIRWFRFVSGVVSSLYFSRTSLTLWLWTRSPRRTAHNRNRCPCRVSEARGHMETSVSDLLSPGKSIKAERGLSSCFICRFVVHYKLQNRILHHKVDYLVTVPMSITNSDVLFHLSRTSPTTTSGDKFRQLYVPYEVRRVEWVRYIHISMKNHILAPNRRPNHPNPVVE
jgi:hypothetical protein